MSKYLGVPEWGLRNYFIQLPTQSESQITMYKRLCVHKWGLRSYLGCFFSGETHFTMDKDLCLLVRIEELNSSTLIKRDTHYYVQGSVCLQVRIEKLTSLQFPKRGSNYDVQGSVCPQVRIEKQISSTPEKGHVHWSVCLQVRTVGIEKLISPFPKRAPNYYVQASVCPQRSARNKLPSISLSVLAYN